MTRNEHQMYSDVSSIAKSLEKIASVLEHVNHDSYLAKQDIPKFQDIPGFEGTLDALDVLTDIKTITDDYASKHDTPTSNNPDPAGYANEASFAFAKALDDLLEEKETCNEDERCDCGNELEDKDVICESCEDETHHEYTYETNLQGIRVDSDHDIRTTAMYYEETVLANGGTKKDCILDYVTNEFGPRGARYTDIIKFAYYLGAPNAPKYSNSNRGYYSCAFSSRMNGHLIQGGKDFLVKGINKEGKERYFAHSSVDNFTDYYKRIA